jgi:CheY-like chemotaxis protein
MANRQKDDRDDYTEAIQIEDLLEIKEIPVVERALSESQTAVLRDGVNKLNNYILLLRGRADDLLRGLARSDSLRVPVGEIWEIADRMASVANRFESIAERSIPFSGTETVLVVDDEEGMTNFLGSTLRECGYQVLEAGDGNQALRVFRDCGGAVDLVLTDIEMKPMNGYELVKTLRTEKPTLKVIYISGLDVDTSVLGPSADFLKKPFPKVRAHIEKVWHLLNRQ